MKKAQSACALCSVLYFVMYFLGLIVIEPATHEKCLKSYVNFSILCDKTHLRSIFLLF